MRLDLEKPWEILRGSEEKTRAEARAVEGDSLVVPVSVFLFLDDHFRLAVIIVVMFLDYSCVLCHRKNRHWYPDCESRRYRELEHAYCGLPCLRRINNPCAVVIVPARSIGPFFFDLFDNLGQ